MEYTLRQATEDDYEFCYNLTKQNMYDLFCRHWGGWVDSEFRKGFLVDQIQIIVSDGKQVGYMNHIVNEDSVYIDNIQIHSESQRKGIGTMVLTDLLTKYQDSVVRLTTFEDNPAKQLYEKLKFSVVEMNGFTIKMEKKPGKALHRMPANDAGER